MFINHQMNESISIGKNYWQDRNKRFGQDIKELEGKLKTQKLFMNMVIHDLRNPAESIKQGLNQAKMLFQKEQTRIILETNKILTKNVLYPTKRHSSCNRSVKEQQNILSPLHQNRTFKSKTSSKTYLLENKYSELNKDNDIIKNQTPPNQQLKFPLNLENKWMPNQQEPPAIKNMLDAIDGSHEKNHNETPSFNERHSAAISSKFKAFNKKKVQIIESEENQQKLIVEQRDDESKNDQKSQEKKIQKKQISNKASSSSNSSVHFCSNSKSEQSFKARKSKIVKKVIEENKEEEVISQKNENKSRFNQKFNISFGNLDNLHDSVNKSQQQSQEEADQIPQRNEDNLIPKKQCKQILEDSHENQLSNCSMQGLNRKMDSNSMNFDGMSFQKSGKLILQEPEELKNINEENEIIDSSLKDIPQKVNIVQIDVEPEQVQNEIIDPFANFDDLENIDIDEFKNQNDDQDQIVENSLSVNEIRIFDPIDNNIILENKNTVQPIIKIVERLVFLPAKQTQDMGTQKSLTKCLMIDQETQYETNNDEEELQNNSQSNQIDKLEEEKEKINQRQMSSNQNLFSNKSQLGSQHQQNQQKMKSVANVKRQKSFSLINMPLEITHYQNQDCRQCLKISKFMIKQLEKVLKINLSVDQYLQNAIFSSMMMTNLINDLLDSAKLEQQTFELDLDYFNIFEVIAQAFQILSFQADIKNIEFLIHFDKSKPYSFCKILNDKRRFLQILLNFISNSLKFTNQNGYIKVHLLVIQEQNIVQSQVQKQSERSSLQSNKIITPQRSGSCINSKQKINLINGTVEIQKFIQMQIIIEDNGIGIKKENLGKLFMDYSKLNEHKKMNQKGTGLGLSICKSIINKMGGQVVVESTEGVGSKFIITLQVKAIDQHFSTPEYLQMPQIEKEKYMEQSGAFNFFPEFKQKFNLKICPDNSNQKQQQKLLVQGSVSDSSSEDAVSNYKFQQTLVVYKFEPNKIIESSSKQEEGKNFKILKELRSVIKNKQSKNKERGNYNSRESMLMSQESNIFQKKQSNRKNHIRKSKSEIGNKALNLSQTHNNIEIKQLSSRDEEEKLDQVLQSNNEYNLSNYSEEKKNDQNIFKSQAAIKNTVKNGNPKRPLRLKSSKELQISCESFNSESSKEKEAAGINQTNLEQQFANVIERKINCLVVNDEEFSLLIITTMLGSLRFIGKIDQASNGQDALDKVMFSERNSKVRQYDIIFLDLNMPILNGFEACQLIKEFYKNTSIRQHASISAECSNKIKKQVSSNMVKQLEILRLKKMIDDYTIFYQQISNEQNQILNDSKEQQLLAQRLILQTYQKVKYWSLDDLKRPYIFAYSALINEETKLKTIEAGFDGCLVSPITVESVEDLMSNFVDKYVTQFITEQLLNQGQNQILNMIINNKNLNSQIQQLQLRQRTIHEEMKESTIFEENKEYSDASKVSLHLPSLGIESYKIINSQGKQNKSQFLNIQYELSSMKSESNGSLKDSKEQFDLPLSKSKDSSDVQKYIDRKVKERRLLKQQNQNFDSK